MVWPCFWRWTQLKKLSLFPNRFPFKKHHTYKSPDALAALPLPFKNSILPVSINHVCCPHLTITSNNHLSKSKSEYKRLLYARDCPSIVLFVFPAAINEPSLHNFNVPNEFRFKRKKKKKQRKRKFDLQEYNSVSRKQVEYNKTKKIQ